MRIDAHQHFWRLERADYGWLTPARGSIYRDFLPDDLVPLLAQAGIDATILVQAAPTEAETQFMLDLAARAPFIAGVVGWSDFEAGDAPQRIAALAANPLLLGFRPMLQDIPESDWLLRPALVPAIEALKRHGLVFDALVRPRHLPSLLTFAKAHPDLVIVIDHCAKPDFGAGIGAQWFDGMAALAALPNTSCKLSGLVTEIGPGWRLDELLPVYRHVLAGFGADRLIWGSDWPVLTRAASYDAWNDATMQMLEPLDDASRAQILGGNARRIYLSERGRLPES